MTGTLGDRRGHLRFDVTGHLWASISATADVTLRNITTRGALVEAPASRLWQTLRTLTIGLRADLDVTGIVKHISGAPTESGHLLIGLEFVHVSPEALVELERLAGQSMR